MPPFTSRAVKGKLHFTVFGVANVPPGTSAKFSFLGRTKKAIANKAGRVNAPKSFMKRGFPGGTVIKIALSKSGYYACGVTVKVKPRGLGISSSQRC